MFSGLVQETSLALKIEERENLLKLFLKKPSAFSDLKKGESIAVDGVCLSLVDFDGSGMSFDLAPETLKITGWKASWLKNKSFNLERSLSLQSALGGQILTGHVDGKALVQKIEKKGDSRLLFIEIPEEFKKFVFYKGYLALNGVSLTVNQVRDLKLEFCLIPDTLRRSNLSTVAEGDLLNFEIDYISRCLNSFIENTKGVWKGLR